MFDRNERGIPKSLATRPKAYMFVASPPTQAVSDVRPDHWAWYFVVATFCVGLTAGYAERKYSPNDAVIRAEMAVFPVNASSLPTP